MGPAPVSLPGVSFPAKLVLVGRSPRTESTFGVPTGIQEGYRLYGRVTVRRLSLSLGVWLHNNGTKVSLATW